METPAEKKCDKDDSVLSVKETIILDDIINTIVKKEGYKDFEVETKLHSIVEQGFLGRTCEINIQGTIGNKGQETNLFIKIMNPDMSTFVKVPEVYVKELFIYGNLMKIYKDLQNEFNVPEAERYRVVKGYSEFPPTVIVLENMNKKGFKTQHRSKIVSLEFAVLAVKQLAKFHALSFVLKAKNPKYFEQNIATLKHSLTFNDDWINFIDNFIGITMAYVNDDIKRKLQVFKTVFVEKYIMYMEDDKFKLCMCHGDFRPCNILMKETNGKVTEIIPIDYQLAYYGCPVMDLIFFMFTSTDQKMRHNIPYLKDAYYQTFETFLKYFDMKAQDVFSREKFEFMYKERLDYGLQISLLVMPILMAPDDNITALDTMASMSHNTDNECRERMMGIIEDFIEWGYL